MWQRLPANGEHNPANFSRISLPFPKSQAARAWVSQKLGMHPLHEEPPGGMHLRH